MVGAKEAPVLGACSHFSVELLSAGPLQPKEGARVFWSPLDAAAASDMDVFVAAAVAAGDSFGGKQKKALTTPGASTRPVLPQSLDASEANAAASDEFLTSKIYVGVYHTQPGVGPGNFPSAAGTTPEISTCTRIFPSAVSAWAISRNVSSRETPMLPELTSSQMLRVFSQDSRCGSVEALPPDEPVTETSSASTETTSADCI